MNWGPQRYAWAKAAGVCTRCKQSATPGVRLCQRHREADVAREAARMAQERVRDLKRAAERARRKDRVAAGLCPLCKGQPLETSNYCARCTAMRLASDQRCRQRRAA